MLVCEAARRWPPRAWSVAVLLGTASVPHMVAVAAVLGCCRGAVRARRGRRPADAGPRRAAVRGGRDELGPYLAGTAVRHRGRRLPVRRRPFRAVPGGRAHPPARVRDAAVPARTPAPGAGRRDAGPAERRPAGRWPPSPPRSPPACAGCGRHRQSGSPPACAVVLNLFFSAFYLVVIVLAHERGVPAGEIGVMAAMLGAGGIVGRARRAVPAPAAEPVRVHRGGVLGADRAHPGGRRGAAAATHSGRCSRSWRCCRRPPTPRS